MKFQTKIAKQIINRQASLWSYVSGSKLRQLTKKKSKNKKYHPSITVSREAGSGGRLVAKLIAKKLHFKFYDKTIVDLIVKKTKKRKDLIQSLDEQSLSFLEETLATFFSKKKISSPSYFRGLVKVFLTLGQKGNCVILGRGANFILPSEHSLKVRIIAPLKVRIKSAMVYEGYKKQRAQNEIKKLHFNRKDFIKKYFFKDISNANYYDLVINTKNLSLEEAAETAVCAFRKKFPKFGLL